MKSFESLVGTAAREAMRDDDRIRSLISRIVPEGALQHITFCRHGDQQLRITLDSAAWISKLRFSERKILAALIRGGYETRTVSWHVAVAKPPTTRATTQRLARGGSAQAARAVLSAAEENRDRQGNDELSRQLERMAKHLQDRGSGD